MHITATHLVQWSDKRETQGQLPLLVRRLISATANITAVDMRGGDSVYMPGWDGVVEVSQGNPWVPTGLSYWELGTSKNPGSKASSDFKKRLDHIVATDAARSTFVFVTTRRWAGKNTWLENVKKYNFWADILVWDADDLEVWLDTSPPTSLWLGIRLGIAGHGIDVVENYWKNWSNQSIPAITTTGLFSGREKEKNTLVENIKQREPLITVAADSQSEAVAFVCALLIEEGDSLRTACITSEEGWQFVDSNPGIELVIITDNQLGNRRAPREGMSLIVPMAFGDQSFNLVGIGKNAITQKPVELRRPKPDEFEKALLGLGVEKSDAARYTRTLGRSWTVFRRWCAQNPAFRRPRWVDATDSIGLLVLTLMGAWNSASEGDKTCVAQVANRPYEDIENELLCLVILDDAPVVKIGSLWKAKAPLELLALMAPRLSDAILERFFQVARETFERADPILELEEDKRYMASVYGKVREHSGVVLEAMAESIAKLGCFSDNSSQVAIGRHVRDFVRLLLIDADDERWLSVSSFLQSFAEAAPDEFLQAVQSSLKKPEKPVTSLITETQSSGLSSRCWHANLLWALELLAWYPARLSRVTSIFAELSDIEVKGNWSNTPFNSLISIFRIWYPQTAASVELRLRVVNNLSNQYPNITWKLLLKLIPKRYGDSASPNAKPRWRDDDAGAGDAVTNEDMRKFLSPIADLLINKAQGNSKRIAKLVPNIDQLDTGFRDKVIALIEGAKYFPDEEREIVRSAVRKFLSRENSYNKDGSQHEKYSANTLRPLFDTLAPDDLVIRHAWIFSSGWVELPDGRNEDYKEADKISATLRISTIQEIYQKLGWQGINSLAKNCGDAWVVGWALIETQSGCNDLPQWLCQRYINQQTKPSFDRLTRGVLHSVSQTELTSFLYTCLRLLEKYSAPANTVAGFLENAPPDTELWQLVEKQPQVVQNFFWQIVEPSYIHSDRSYLLLCVEKLLAADRPRTAIAAIGDRAAELPREILIQMLKSIVAGQEGRTALPSTWYFSRVFKALVEKGCAQLEMARLEFSYYSILQHDEYQTPNLISEILSNPLFFMELVCLVYKSHKSDSDIPEHLRSAAETAGALLSTGRGVPGKKPDGSIVREQFFSWVHNVREIAAGNGREVITDQIIGTWLSDWPLNKKLDCWPSLIIAELLDQDNHEEIRQGFHMGVFNSQGVTCRMPYDGGNQERKIAAEFRRFSNHWQDSKPNLAELIESLAKSYDQHAQRSDESGLWAQEL